MFYRLRRRVNYSRFCLATREIHASPPISCDGGNHCEIHTMLSRDDFPLYLVAIKSFLRFYREVGVVVHSDGTLDARCEARLRQHIPGCRIVPYHEADRLALDRLGPNSEIYRWRSHDASYRRVVDTELWSQTPARIIMDADILVLDEPTEVIHWIEDRSGSAPFLMGQPPQVSAKVSIPAGGARPHMQTIFKQNVEALGRELGEPACFLDGTTSGFYGCYDQLSLERIERVIGASEGLGIPMKEWGGEQCTVIYILSCAGASHLDSDKYFNFFRDQTHKVRQATLIHFIGTDRFYRQIYSERAAEVVRLLVGNHGRIGQARAISS